MRVSLMNKCSPSHGVSVKAERLSSSPPPTPRDECGPADGPRGFGKDPLCCRFRPCRTECDEPPHYHTRHSLTSITHNEHRAAMNQGAAGAQLPESLFVVGKPNDYHLNGALPRLPSYESVRKKDRQRRIHSLISERFGLSGCHDQPPPTYEDTLRQSVDIPPANLRSLDVHPSVHPQDHNSNLNEDTHNPGRPPAPLQGPSSVYSLAQSFMFPSVGSPWS